LSYENGVTLDRSRPGKPTNNAFVKPFNGWLRDAYLNDQWSLSLVDARVRIEACRRYDRENHLTHRLAG
jgi:putative transposase